MADFDDSSEAWLKAARGGESTANVRFDMRPVKDEAKSLAEGRPIFTPTEYIRIQQPGDRLNVIHRPMTATDRHQYARQYADWKARGDAAMPAGTPLAEWPGIAASTVEELRHFGCLTVEQLASMSDSNLGNVGVFIQKRQAARDYVARAKADAPAQKLEAINAELRSELAALKAQVEAMVANGIPKVDAPKPRGRKVKAPEA